MMKKFNALKNYNSTLGEIGYVELSRATLNDYRRIGFKSGLEVHQQLKTRSKLFCRCPAGIYHDHDNFNAEVIRHMRPTLSELGVYDGTALMEFKTRKEIIYRINNVNACTYEVDDTPPFPIDREALEIALEISLLSKLNIVGEVHITRKQYLDGSIPTGFQRTAILGVEGEISISNKKVRLIQLSIEEDSCREISDVGHTRVYKTDRLGMPLIETVTYPDMETPWELAEAAEYIRFLNRSTGKVRTGIGAGREDVNVSCEGGSRVEIKGVAHNSWIPLLSHNEAFRQYALLNIRKKLRARVKNGIPSAPSNREIGFSDQELLSPPVKEALDKGFRVIAINLPDCLGILSHFTQPGHVFADEFINRLKVIACIEKPNMTHSEEQKPMLNAKQWEKVRTFLGSGEKDAQIILWGPDDDIPTAIETVIERLKMAYDGVPNETRKSFRDGTTIFERVLPGSDRMYPDTDSAPIPLTNDYIVKLGENLPVDVSERYNQLRRWKIPADTYRYLLSKNMLPLIEKISGNFGFDPKFTGTFLGHTFKNIEGTRKAHKMFSYNIIVQLFRFIKENGLEKEIATPMLQVLYEHPKMRYDSILTTLHFKKLSMEEIIVPANFLYKKFREESVSVNESAPITWLMGQLRQQAAGNVSPDKLRKKLEEIIDYSNTR
ncbi:MAG: Glu-tRNA(Gln) amidotransferase subunit GatE [Bacteroidia bacterium]|nr:MAG: Glu-tRNA(Gln) amidotransferase subunit GatE [Bacteroidia bacterium]